MGGAAERQERRPFLRARSSSSSTPHLSQGAFGTHTSSMHTRYTHAAPPRVGSAWVRLERCEVFFGGRAPLWPAPFFEEWFAVRDMSGTLICRATRARAREIESELV